MCMNTKSLQRKILFHAIGDVLRVHLFKKKRSLLYAQWQTNENMESERQVCVCLYVRCDALRWVCV